MPGLRRCAVSFVGQELPPGETREITVEVASAFRADRLSFARPPQTRWQRAAATVVHVLSTPWLIARSIRTVRALLRQRAEDRRLEAELVELDGPDFDDDDDDELELAPLRVEIFGVLRPIWRVPWPAPPIDVLDVRVGVVSQTPAQQAIPAEVFAEMPRLELDTARPGQCLTLVVRNHSRAPYTLRGAWMGSAFT